jgi:phosphoribosylanthranilate isomerase
MKAAGVKGVVAVFAGNSEAEIQDVIEHVGPDVVQMPLSALHLSRKSFSSDIPIWNTIRVGEDEFSTGFDREGAALHFDTSVAGVSGGTGRTFDWSLLAAVDRSRPLILAGGLNPENVAEAVRRVKPDVVDVASGVESAPGIKDREKIAAFVGEVRRA